MLPFLFPIMLTLFTDPKILLMPTNLLYSPQGINKPRGRQLNVIKVYSSLHTCPVVGSRQIGRRNTQEWAVDLQNLTNSKNVMSVFFDEHSGDYSTIYTQGFTPMITYKLFFSVR